MSRLTKTAIVGFGVLGLVWVAGGIWFASTIPTTVSDITTKTDAIVVLTGGRGRIETGIALLENDLAGRLFVSGAGEKLRPADLVSGTDETGAALQRAITLGREAEDTPGNALETAAWARREQVGSIRLVTAAYHMPRSLLELHAAMPAVAIVPHPVFPTNVKPDWWRWPGTARLIAGEYTKFLLTRLRIAVDGRLAPQTTMTSAAQSPP